MSSDGVRQDFASDNTAGLCPEAWAALGEANSGSAASYGDDVWTARLRSRVRELFETDCDVHLVFSGTAANAIAIAQLCQSFHSVVCHEHAHIQTDECGAPEFFSNGAKLLLTGGADGKVDLSQTAGIIAQQPELHAQKPRVLSVTQATEFGTVYTREELSAVRDFAAARDMCVHMDGARFANAVAHLNCAPKEITWEAGVDVLCFGGTKNGLAAGELIVTFRPQLGRDIDYRIKQAGQLGSKARFLAAPWLGLLGDGTWLKNARRANAAAQSLGEHLRKAGVDIVFPIQANSVFLRLSDAVVAALRKRGWYFYKFVEPDVYRLMCAWSTTDRAIDELVADAKAAKQLSDL